MHMTTINARRCGSYHRRCFDDFDVVLSKHYDSTRSVAIALMSIAVLRTRRRLPS